MKQIFQNGRWRLWLRKAIPKTTRRVQLAVNNTQYSCTSKCLLFSRLFFLQCGKKLCYAIYHCSQTLTIYYYLFTIKWNCFWRSIHIHFPTPCNYAVCTSSFVSGFFFPIFCTDTNVFIKRNLVKILRKKWSYVQLQKTLCDNMNWIT